MKPLGLLQLSVCVLTSVWHASSEPLKHWSWLSPLPTGLPLRHLHFDGKAFLAAGARAPWEVLATNYVAPTADALIRSIDGTNWVVVQIITNGPVIRLQSDAGEALAFTRTDAWRSPDGVHWTVQPLHLPEIHPQDYYLVGRADGRFVAVRRTFARGEDGKLHLGQFVSVDGVDWKLTGASAEGRMETGVAGLAHGNGRWVELLGTGQVYVSTNSETWESGTAVSPNVINPNGSFLQFESGEFFAGVASGRLSRSKDGLNWTEWFTGHYHILLSIARGSDAWIITAGGGRLAMRTTDFSTVELVEIQPKTFGAFGGSACRYGNGQFVSVSDGSDSIGARRSGQIHTSPDGRTWTQQNPIVTSWITSASAQGNGRIVAVGNSAINGNGNVAISQDGVGWRHLNIDVPSPIQSIVFGAGRFVALGRPYNNAGYPVKPLLTSTNGVDWLSHMEFTNAGISRLTFGNSRFLVASDSSILVSQDALNWEQRPLPAGFRSTAFIFGGNQFISGSIDGWIYRSPDGLDWTRHEISGAKGRVFYPGTYGQGLFLQSSADGTVISSRDGENWQVMENALPSYGLGMAYGRGWFVAAPLQLRDNALYASQDGIHWTRVLASAGEVIHALDFYGERFLAFGDWATILQSDPLPAVWEPSLRLVGRSTGRFQIAGTPNKRHRIEMSTTLNVPIDWQPRLELALPNSGVVEFELPTTPDDAIYYRVGLLPE